MRCDQSSQPRSRSCQESTSTNPHDRVRQVEDEELEYYRYLRGEVIRDASKLAALGRITEESVLVNKFLNSLPRSKYIQITASV